jgi:hypothetical protein
MAQRMASGGGAFKKIAFMQAGGAAKGVAKGFKKLFADRDVMPAIERDANLQKFMAKSQVKEPVFHAAKTDVKQFSPKHRTELSSMGHHFGTAEQANFRTGQYDFGSETPNIGKYHLNIENPLEVSHMASYAPDHLADQLMDMNLLTPERYDALAIKHNYNSVALGDELAKVLQKNGYDGLKYANEMEGEGFSFVPLKPTQIKSAIGNRGTYDINESDLSKAEGGPAFKTLQFREPQKFDGGGIASPEESSGYSPESFFDSKRYSDIKKNAAEMYDEGKKSLASDYDRLKSSGRARAQLAKIAALQLAGGAPDLAHLGVDLIVDPLKSVTVDKLLTKPKYRSVLEGPANPNSPRLEDRPQREPMFGSLSDSLKTADGLPIGGSEHMIKRAQDAGLMSQGRFSPLTEIPAAILGGAGISKLGKGAVKGYDKLTGEKSVKLFPLQPEAMTASTGTPQGATYATKQEGPFYRVSPTSLDVSGAKSRGLREADELQGQAPVGGRAGQAGSEVPLRISDEEVARLISDPASNQPLQIAQRFTKETQGTDFAKPDIPESSLAKQSAIGRAHQLAVEGSPEYKNSVFDAYAKQMPDVLEQAGAKNYDDLMEKARSEADIMPIK